MANAPPVPPPAAPAPIVVTVVAAPITPTLHATLLANEALVLATPYLQWEAVPPVAGAPARVRLSQRILLYVFVMRCRLSTTANLGKLAGLLRLHAHSELRPLGRSVG